MREDLVFEIHGVEINTINLSHSINVLGLFAKILGLFTS